MLRVYATLVGFALLGALFAAVYYAPEHEERIQTSPRYRFGPGNSTVDFVEAGNIGENITVNITVIAGGPIQILVMDFDALAPLVDANNSTISLRGPLTFIQDLSEQNVSNSYNFRIISDGETRLAIVMTSLAETQPGVPHENQTTEVSVRIRYVERERKDIMMGYVMAIPSVALVSYTIYRHRRRRRRGTLGGHDPPAKPALPGSTKR